ncbi:MAG: minor capsid protein, partial [Patescibacteria group bacterium]|nr:minor capsid protein [Patescibacteria group bacterium]
MARERAAATEMVQVYGLIWQQLQDRLQALWGQMASARAAGEPIDVSWLLQADRLRDFQLQVEAQINGFAQYADTAITGQQAAAVQAAQRDAVALLTASGVTTAFDVLPTQAIQQLVGQLSDGSPLTTLLSQLGPDAGQAARSALIEGIATGQGQATIARALRKSLGGNMVRALTISRTETLRAYREASRAVWQQHSDVVTGWVWVAGNSSRTCAFCWSMDGSVHPLDEQMASHPRCRCTSVPKTKTWAELGYTDAPETSVQRP